MSRRTSMGHEVADMISAAVAEKDTDSPTAESG
jgi:hypothetical protein